ncbi:MAG: sulfatase-like hydrolase/transferase, partial [Limisphaerales bacterium]
MLLLVLSLSVVLSRANDRPPNFVLIFVDDLGYADLGCFGSPDIQTPRLDGLAKEGMRFTHFYAQHICGPSRAALMTGRHPQRSGVNSWCQRNMTADGTFMALEEVTLAETLQ